MQLKQLASRRVTKPTANHLNKSRTAVAFLATGVLLFGFPVSAQAQTGPADEVSAALQAATDRSSSVATDVLGNVAKVRTVAAGKTAIGARVAGTDITVPTNPSDKVRIKRGNAAAISVKLPFADTASNAIVVSDGVVAFDNENGSVTAPVVKDDGSLQITTVIESASAPTRYPYTFDLPAGATIVESGGALFFMDGEKLLGGIAPAWAEDASGEVIPPHYEVDGMTVTQVVEHLHGSVSYPVVADPWMGIRLFQRIYVDRYNGDLRANLDLSAWGWFIYTGTVAGPSGMIAGQVILNTAGWDEAWTYNSDVRYALNKPTMRQQFECHALGAAFAGTWNLERFRHNRTWHW